MAEFFLSPESQRGIDDELYRRQRRHENAVASVTPQMQERLIAAHRLNPSASAAVKQAYAVTGMSDDEYLELSTIEAERRLDDEGGFFGRIGDALNDIGMAAWNQVVKPAVRGAILFVDAAAQELVQRPLTSAMAVAGGEAESFSQAYADYGDSALVNALQARFPGLPSPTNRLGTVQDQAPQPFDVGTGLFAGGAAAELTERERILTIQGQRASFGRSFADVTVGNFYSPGDNAYDITAGIAQFAGDVLLDPTALATLGTTRAITAAKGLQGTRTLGKAIRGVSIPKANIANELVEQAGLISTSTRNTVVFEQARRLFGNRKVLDDLAASDSATILQRMNLERIGARGDDLADLIVRLGDETDPAEIGNILIDAAQRGHVRERGFYAGHGKYIRNPKEAWRDLRIDQRLAKNLPETRYGGIQPSRTVSANNRLEAAIDLDGLLRLAKIGTADRATIVNRTLRVAGNDELFDVATDSFKLITRKLEGLGLDGDEIDELTRAYKAQTEKVNAYLLDSAGDPALPPWGRTKTVRVHGIDEDVPVPQASMIAHLNNQAIPLPDPTDIRRATTKFKAIRTLYQSNGWELGTSAARFTTRYLFKFPTLFTRIAYPLRNLLDNEARAAAAGYDSLFSHPARWLAAGVLDPHKFKDLTSGGDLNEVMRGLGALSAKASGMWADDGMRRLGTYRTYARTDEGFVTAWRSQLGRFRNDPIASKVADTERFATRDDLIDAIVADGDIEELSSISDEARDLFYRQGTDPDRAAVNTYIDWIEDHIADLTNGDPNLRRTIATGDLDGINFNDLTENKRINQILRDRYLDTAAPRRVTGDTLVADSSKAKRLMDDLMDGWVDWMATRPENRFTRFPLAAQMFADDLARSMPSLADDTLRLQLVEKAADAGFDGKLFSRIAQAAQDASGQRGAIDNLEDVIDAAKLHSADQVKEVAFDVTRKSSFQEMADVVFPFWDAYVDVTKSWIKLNRDNPAAFARGVGVLNAGRGTGTFYVNDHGEEVFAYPGGGLIAKALGIKNGSVRLEGRLEGLNLAVQGIGPGFGPLVQWAAGAFTPDTPDLQWVRDIVLPFGTDINAPSDLTPTKMLGELTPAWLQKAFNVWSDGDIDPVAFNSAVGDAIKVLATTGAYKPGDPEDQRRLLEHAEKAARWTTWLRSLLQMGAPTGPSVTWEIQTDPDGQWHRLNVMADAYYDLLDQFDEQTATMTFIDLYGVEPFYIAQAKTKSLIEQPVTREGQAWVQRHAGAAERHREVIGYFVPPENPESDLDYGIWRQQIEEGTRISLDPATQLQMANQGKARAIYNALRTRTEELPTGNRRRVLASARAALEEQFPGWQSQSLGVQPMERDERIRRLALAVRDSDLADSPVAEPLGIYLTARENALAALAQRPQTSFAAQANADIRSRLHDLGQRLVTDYGEFQGVWQHLLSSEVEDRA